MTKAPTKALATLRHLGAVGLSPALAFEAATPALQDLIGFDSATLVIYGDELQPREARLTHELSPTVARRYFQRWYNREEARYIPTHGQAARGRAPDLIRISDFQSELWETELYDEVFGALGFHWMTSLTLRQGSRAVGNISLGRAAGADFSAADLRRLSEAAQWASLALAGPTVTDLDGVGLDETESGLVLTDGDGRIQHLSENGSRLLRWASPLAETTVVERLRQMCENEALAWAKPILTEMAGRVRHALMGLPGPAPLMRRHTRHGEFVLRGQALYASGGGAGDLTIAIQIQRLMPRIARLFRSATFRALTFQEQTVCRLFLQGLSQPDIAREMGLSPHTVVSHIRSLYARTGATSRETLQAAILAEPEPPVPASRSWAPPARADA